MRTKNLFLFVMLSLLVIKLKAADAKTDSIESLIKRTKNIEHKIDLINELSLYYFENLFNEDKSLELAQKALKLAQENKYAKGIAFANRRFAYVYRQTGNLDKAEEHGQLAMLKYEEIDHKSGISWCLRHDAFLAKERGDFPKAMELHQASIKIAIKVQDQEQLYWNYRALGEIQVLLGNYNLALNYYEKALAISQQQKDALREIGVYDFMGNVYHFKGNYPKSLEYYYKALELSEVIGNDAEKSWILNNIGAIYYYQKDYKNALHFYKQAESLKTILNEQRGLAHISNNIGEILHLQGKYDSALFYFAKSLSIATKFGERKLQPLVFLNQGMVYEELGNFSLAESKFMSSFIKAEDINYNEFLSRSKCALSRVLLKQGKRVDARLSAQNAFDVALQTKNLEILKDAAQALAHTYEESENYSEAYRFYQLYKNLSDSLYNENSQKTIYNLSIGYETDKKEQQIRFLSDKNMQQKRLNVIMVVSMVLLAFSLILLVNRFKMKRKVFIAEKQKAEAQAEEQKARRKQAEMETKLIQEEALRKEEELKATAELNQINAERIQEELEHRNREITSTALHVAQKNEILTTISEKLDALKEFIKTENKKELNQLKRLIKENIELDDDWNNFKMHFEQVHPRFFEKLSESYPELTSNEQKICAYLRMNLSGKEIARLMNITSKSAQMSRYRLKKKFNLGADDDLIEFINQV